MKVRSRLKPCQVNLAAIVKMIMPLFLWPCGLASAHDRH